MTEPGKNSPLYIKLITAVVAVVLFVLIAEFALRLIDPQLGFKNQFFPVNRDIDFPEFYEKDAKLFWKLRPDETLESRWFSNLSYKINSAGLRGPEIKKEKPRLRILALGNSCTFGWGVPYENCFSKLLQDKLNQGNSNNDAEVINAGIPGYSSYQGKIMLKKLLPLKPDVVLIMFGWNDHWRAGKGISDAEQKSPPQVVISLQNAFSRLRIYKLIRSITLNLTEDTTFVRMDDMTGKRRVGQKEFIDNLKEIVEIARAHDIKPVLMVPPIASLVNYNLGRSSNLHLLHYRYQEEVKRVSEYMDVPLVDLQIDFDKYNDLFDDPFGDPIHFNSKGHAVAADAILNAIDTLVNFSAESSRR